MHFQLSYVSLLGFLLASLCFAFPLGFPKQQQEIYHEVANTSNHEVDSFLESPRTNVYIPGVHLKELRRRADNGTSVNVTTYRWLSPEYKLLFARKLPIPPVLTPLTSYTNTTTGEIFDFYEMTIEPLKKQIYPGLQPASFEGYNGQVPGPHIKAQVGRRSVVRFINKLDIPASIHLHGSPTRPPFDGYAEDITLPGQYKDYVYPNENARTLWFHDHSVGHTAMSVYKGQVGYYWITNPALEERFKLPQGRYDIALALTDRRYFQSGRLWDHIGEETTQDDPDHVEQFGEEEDDDGDRVHIKTEEGEAHSFYGDIIHVNGMPWPYLNVEPRKYRFRLLDASISRTYHLTFEDQDGTPIPFHVIGTDSGFMEAPVETRDIVVAIAERYEIVVDFANYAGQTVHLKNARNFSKNEDFVLTNFVMQFVVGANGTVVDSAGNGPLPDELVTIDYPVKPGVIDRSFELNFVNRTWRINNYMFKDVEHRIQAAPKQGSVEVWQVINRAGTWAHPLHIHLIDFKVLTRSGGENRGVESWEAGYKDVVFLEPGENVTVIARFLPWPGEYMFHCHNLIHEDTDMMAVFDVNDTHTKPQNGDIFSNPMEPRFRAKPYTGADLINIQEVLLPSISALDVYPKRVIEEASRFLGGGITNFELEKGGQ